MTICIPYEDNEIIIFLDDYTGYYFKRIKKTNLQYPISDFEAESFIFKRA